MMGVCESVVVGKERERERQRKPETQTHTHRDRESQETQRHKDRGKISRSHAQPAPWSVGLKFCNGRFFFF